MAKKPHPLPEWFSEKAQSEARKARDEDELFGAAYNEGMRDAQKKHAEANPRQRHKSTSSGLHGAQFTGKSVVRGIRRGFRAARR